MITPTLRIIPQKNFLENAIIDTFDGAKPQFLNRGKKGRSVSTPAYRQAGWACPGLQTGESNGLIFKDQQGINKVVSSGRGFLENFLNRYGIIHEFHRKVDLFSL